MAKVNLTLPNLELDKLNDSQVIRKIASYLYIQNEQLRYELTHIDEDNMSSESTTTVQGMTQAQMQKAIEEAAKKSQDIDLSSNTIIINLQRRLDNLGKLQAQDASMITRITQELGTKVSTTTYNAGLAGLKALINGNTSLISGLNTNLGQLVTNLGSLSNSYSGHKHQLSIDANGVISMGGPRASVTNPNISATAYFIQRLADARPHSIAAITLTVTNYSGDVTVFCLDDEEFDVPIVIDATTVYQNGQNLAEREWKPDNISQDGNKVTVLNAAGDTIGGPYSIDIGHTTEREDAAYGLSAPEYMTAGTEVDSSGWYYYRRTKMNLTTLYE